ncbi:MAG: DUF697 domain-containing protein [Cyanobacteria bacterium P01_A01_bin.84]
MVVKLQRPILIGGVGLSFLLWIIQIWHNSILQIGEWSIVSLAAIGGGLWLLKKNRISSKSDALDTIPVERVTVENAIASSQTTINQLAQENKNHQALEDLQGMIPLLQAELDRKCFSIAVTGGKSVGKTKLIEVLEEQQQQKQFKNISYQETAALFTEAGKESDNESFNQVNKSDFVLFLTNGDLTESEFQALQQIKAATYRTLVVLNKQDQYLADERASIINAIEQRTGLQVLAAAASPAPIKVRKYQEDGTIKEWMEQPAAELSQLQKQLNNTLSSQSQQLIWATTMRKALTLTAEAKHYLNEIRRDRAVLVIEKYQWIAAAAAFANPVPALDILATAAVNTQMVVDLGNIYQQKFSLEQAQTAASTMGGLMLKLGLVELSTKAIGTVLKSNAVTFVAGGAVQGVSAAYLTRIAGLTLVEYFQQQEITANSESGFNMDKLKQTLQNVFHQNQQIAYLQRFVKQGVQHLSPSAQQV